MARRRTQHQQPLLPQLPPAALPASLLQPRQQPQHQLSGQAISRLREIAAELLRRKTEATRLYRPLVEQGRFHLSESTLRLLRGSNRGGKTLPAAVEVARAVTGRDPHDKYPLRDGRCFAVGKDGKHVAQVMWRKLSRAGAFRMIRDLNTDAWRAFDPQDPADDARFKESKPAPPLIPQRYIQEISWENKKANQPETVKLKTGWELNFFSSLGKPPQGSDIDLWWFDEEIVDPAWLPEMQARTLDRRGKGIWSATPQAGTEQLYELHETADKLKDEGVIKPEVEEFVILLAHNPHIREEDKRKFAEALSEEEKSVRVDGNFLLLSYLIYPDYRQSYHGMKTPVDGMERWSYYAIIDPGHQVCGVLFVAVPPPPLDFGLIYDELYLKDASAAIFGKEMAGKCQGKTFQAFVVDPQGAVLTDIGYGKTVGEQYTEALRRLGVKSEQTGHGFVFAINDVDAGHLAVKGWLAPRADGTPRLRVDPERCPNFDYEIKRYHRKRNPDGTVSDKPYTRKATHLMDCFDEKTEVLTYDGWKLFQDVSKGDLLSTVDLETDLIEYQCPTELISRHHDGEMVQFGGHKLDALVTPRHRMVVYSKGSTKPEISIAEMLYVTDRIKLHAKWTGNDHDLLTINGASRHDCDVNIDAGDLAEVEGWYVAEGSRSQKIQMPGRGYQVLISQVKESGKARLRELFSRLPWHFNEFRDGFRTNSCKQLWGALEECGDGSGNKVVPRWIRDASPRIIERFLDGAVAGDGWTQAGRRSYATVSKLLADQMQELFLKIGRSASVRLRQGEPYEIRGRRGVNTRDQYWVSEWTCPHGTLRDSKDKPNYGRVPYSGMVYCATVPNGTLIVRRNGKPMVSGNCLRYMALYEPKWVRPPARRQDSSVYDALKRREARRRQRDGVGGIHLGPPRRQQ